MPAIIGNPGQRQPGSSAPASTSSTWPRVSCRPCPTSPARRPTPSAPPRDPAQGEAFVESLINALMQSSEWSHTALLLTYDDSGGWYDHAVHRRGGGRHLGLRVPAILVSPYARAGYVDSSQLDTASIPGLIDRSSSCPAHPAGGRRRQRPDRRSTSISSPSRRTSVRPRAPWPPWSGRRCGTIYVLYLGALLAAILLLLLATFRQRRVPPVPRRPAGGRPVTGAGHAPVGTTPPTPAVPVRDVVSAWRSSGPADCRRRLRRPTRRRRKILSGQGPPPLRGRHDSGGAGTSAPERRAVGRLWPLATAVAVAAAPGRPERSRRRPPGPCRCRWCRPWPASPSPSTGSPG